MANDGLAQSNLPHLAAGFDFLAALLASVHALHHKREVIVYDYVDGCVPVLSAMYSKRVRGYEAVGYSILTDDS